MPPPNKPSSTSEIVEAALTELPDVVAALDLYAADATGDPSRGELVIRILRDWLITNGYLDADPLEALADDTEQLP